MTLIFRDLKAEAAQQATAAAAARVPALEANVAELKGRLDSQQKQIDRAASSSMASGQPYYGGNSYQARDPRGAAFIDRASTSFNNRQPWEKNFGAAFSPSPAEQRSMQDNPSNASTSMQSGKAVYNDDGYTITADDDSNVTIFNKKTKETYKAWGDPHMDVDGKRAFDFKDGKTLQLAGGPKVTMGVVDGGDNSTYTSKLTITNGGYGAQIIGIDGKTKGDLAVKEFRSQGRELDKQVDDGTVLEENENMTINDGRGFVVSDQNGWQTVADQAYINRVEAGTSKVQSTQNVGRFDAVQSDYAESYQAPACYDRPAVNDYSKAGERPSRYEMLDSAPADRRSALRSLMDWCKPSWDSCFKSASQPRSERQREEAEPRQAQRPARTKIKINIPNGLNASLNMALNLRNMQSADVRLQVWG